MSSQKINYDYLKNIKLLFSLRRFVPNHEIEELQEIRILLGTKYKGIIFDVDQTLISYKEDVVNNNSLNQIRYLSSLYKCCLLSNYFKNGKQVNRLNKISNQVCLPLVVTNNKKPSPLAFGEALKTLNLVASEVVMVGDRIITDIVGANNLGIATIYKKPIDIRADPFLLVTIPRIIELFLLKAIKGTVAIVQILKHNKLK